jgi:hypothetical protein
VEVSKGTYSVVVTDTDMEFIPGIYQVRVRVSEGQYPAVKSRLPKDSQTIEAQTVASIGTPFDTCLYANKTATEFLKLTHTLREHHPALMRMAMLAFDNKLSAADWRRWQAQNPLSATRDRMMKFLLAPGLVQVLPHSHAKGHQLLLSVADQVRLVDMLMGDRQNQEVFAGVKRPTEDMLGKIPAADSLDTTLFFEGRAIYATAAEWNFDQVVAAHTAFKSKRTPATMWTAQSDAFRKRFDTLRDHFEAFSGLEWTMDSTERRLRVLEFSELLPQIAEFIAVCGRDLEGGKSDGKALEETMTNLRQRFTALKSMKPS